MNCKDLKAAILQQSESTGASARQFCSSANEAPGKIRETQYSIDLAGQFHQSLSAAAVLLRQMQVMGNFQHDRDLVGEGASAANVFLRDARTVQTIEHGKHAQHFSVCAQQRNGKKLTDVVVDDRLEVWPGIIARF